jgi:hypothetical protein
MINYTELFQEFKKLYQLGYIGLLDIKIKSIKLQSNLEYLKLVNFVHEKTKAKKEPMIRGTHELIRVILKAFKLKLL